MDDIEAILYASPKRENDIDDIETIPYVSLKREMALMIRKQPPILPQEGKARRKLTKIIYKQPKLETVVEIEIKLQRQKKKLSKVNWNKTRLIFKFQENLILNSSGCF